MDNHRPPSSWLVIRAQFLVKLASFLDIPIQTGTIKGCYDPKDYGKNYLFFLRRYNQERDGMSFEQWNTARKKLKKKKVLFHKFL